MKASLLRSLDIYIYIQIICLYLSDQSLFRLVLRAVVQLHFLTPKPLIVPRSTATRLSPKNVVLAIFLSNFVCLVGHQFSIPFVPEEAQGYLHGGLIIDFVGQTPASKFRLFVWDTYTCFLQVLMYLVVKTPQLPEQRNGSQPYDPYQSGQVAVELDFPERFRQAWQNFESGTGEDCET